MTEDKIKPIARRLFEEMERLGLTAYRVSVDTGIAQPTFTKYRKGQMQPTREVLEKLYRTYPDFDLFYVEFGARNSESVPPKTFTAVAQDSADDVSRLLTEQVRNQQKMIDHLVAENRTLMELLQAKLADGMA